MSSKDVIISDIARAIVEQKVAKSDGTNHFHLWTMYCFTTIKSIHNINCDVHLNFGFNMWHDEPNDFNVVLKIVHSNMFEHESCEYISLYNSIIGRYKKFDRENISAILDKVKLQLSKLQFSVYSGLFVPYQSTRLAEIDFFQDIKSIKYDGEECPICKENIVATKTYCEHYLCVPCFQQIKLTKDEDDNEIRKCPMCREEILYTKS
jgi:hypothetical protein